MRILALDPGERRIGVAVTEEGRARAHAVWPHNRSFWARLAAVIAEGQTEHIVVGRPRSLGGELGGAARAAEDFAHQVRLHTGLPVTLIDETATTEIAEHRLPPGQEPDFIDAVAAQIILEDYLSEH